MTGDIGTLTFDHYSLRISVYHSCRARAFASTWNYLPVVKISLYRRQLLCSVGNDERIFNHMDNEGAKRLGLIVLYEGETPDVEWVF